MSQARPSSRISPFRAAAISYKPSIDLLVSRNVRFGACNLPDAASLKQKTSQARNRPGTLIYAEALDSGDWNVNVPARDKGESTTYFWVANVR